MQTCQMEIASWLESPLPRLSTENPAGLICAGPVHAAMVSVNLSVNKSCFIWKTLFAWNHPSLLVLKVFLCLLLHDSLISERRSLLKTSYLEVSCLKSFVLETLTCTSIWVKAKGEVVQCLFQRDSSELVA